MTENNREWNDVTPFIVRYARLAMLGVLMLVSQTRSSDIGMVAIPSGHYERSDGASVRLDSFAMFATETTWSQWQHVRRLGRERGYDIRGGIGEADRPVQNVIWYDAVKWLNALSEIEGRSPAYYEDAEHTQPYRTGEIDVCQDCVDWQSKGYRLPTEAEWEYAYRAGTTTKYYWGDHAREDRTNTKYAVIHYWGNPEITGGPHPVAGKIPNRFGLFDMAGNVEEWCWDRYVRAYEGIADNNPKGPHHGSFRVLRGGGMVMDRMFGATDRHFTYPWYISMDTGFRVASSDIRADARTLVDAPLLPIPSVETKPFSIEKRLTYRPDDDEDLARRLFGHINLSSQGLEQIRMLFEAGEFSRALAAYRDYFVEKLKQSPLEIERYTGAQPTLADGWVARMEAKERIQWYGPGSRFTKGWIGPGIAQNLASSWIETGKEEYLQAWAWLATQLARYQKTDWNALTFAEKASGPSDKSPDRYWFSRSIGYDAGGGMLFPEQLAYMVKHPPESAEAIIPPRTLAHVLLMTVEECTGIGLKDDRSNVPNQLIGNGITFIKQGLVLSEFHDSEIWLAVGIRRVLRASGTVMSDGTDIEYSINYNASFVHKVDQLNALYDGPGQEWPEWLEQLNHKSDQLIRMYGAIAMPNGAFPSVGNQSYEVVRPRQLLEGWLGRGVSGLADMYSAIHRRPDDPSPPPRFSSIALPFAGYYVQRQGWRASDLYLFMKSSRPGAGHRHADNNGIQMVAYGRHLLVDCAAPPYGPQFLPEDQRVDHMWLGEDGYYGSSFSACTVVVDGCSQKKPPKVQPDRGYVTTIGSRWHSSSRFDLTEGEFADGYRSDKPLTEEKIEELVVGYGRGALEKMIEKNKTLRRDLKEVDARHHRQIMFIKEAGFWIVTDRIEGGSRYTQIWNLPPPHEGENRDNYICPGFSPGQVRFDEDEKWLQTIDPRDANVALRHFIDSPLSYELKFGEKYPFRGWFSFGIGGEKVPSVEVHASWSGSAPLVTAIIPLQDRTDRGQYRSLCNGVISGFERVADDRTVTYLTAPRPMPLMAGPVSIKQAEALLVVQDNAGISGVVLGGENVRLGRHPLVDGDFEFVQSPGRAAKTKSIGKPTSFAWINDNDGVRPEYNSQ